MVLSRMKKLLLGAFLALMSMAERRSASGSCGLPVGVAEVVAASTASLGHQALGNSEPLRRRHHTGWWWRQRQDEADTPEKEWIQDFRVPRSVFTAIVDAISSHSLFRIPSNIGARAVPVEKQVAAFLQRIGANLPVHTVRKNLEISESSVTGAVRRVSFAINSCLKHLVTMPRNGSERKAKVKAMFAKRQFPAASDSSNSTRTASHSLPSSSSSLNSLS
jgi:hypothetical protein